MRELLLESVIPQQNWENIPLIGSVDDVSEYIAENGLGLYVADGHRPNSSDKKVIIQYPQWSDGTSHNPMSKFRTWITAANTGKLVILVDNLGVELGRPRMEKDVRRSLLQGDFRTGSIQQWEAIEEVLDNYDLKFDAISRVMGASLGAHVAAAAVATAPRQVHLDRLSLWETAGLDKRKSLVGFALNYVMHGPDRMAELVRTNPDWAEELRQVKGIGSLAKLALHRPEGLIYYPIAIHRHNIAKTLIDAKNKKDGAIDGDTITDILYGSDSLVSPGEFNERLARNLAQAGLKVALFESEGGVHDSQDNMGWWSYNLRQIEQQIHQNLA